MRVTKEEKESQLDRLREEQRESIENVKTTTFTEEILRDYFSKPISIGDWVKVTTKGRFNSEQGRVKIFKKWVTFEDETGVEQVRAPSNLIVQDVREHSDSDRRRKLGGTTCNKHK